MIGHFEHQAMKRRRENEQRRKLWLALSAGFIVCLAFALMMLPAINAAVR